MQGYRMSAAQLENGYTRIANEILEALCRLKLSTYETRVLWFIIRKTYGHQKKMDRISLSQFSGGTGIEKSNARRAIRSLIDKRMVTTEREGFNQVFYGVQKYYDQWKGVSVETPTKERKKKERVRDKPSPSKNSDPTVKEFLSWWGEEYQRRVGEPFDFSWGKDGAIIKGRLRVRDLPKLKEIAVRFFDDPWVQQNGGYTIDGFARQINKLASTAKANDNRPQRKEMPA